MHEGDSNPIGEASAAPPAPPPTVHLDPRRFRFRLRLWLPDTAQALNLGVRRILQMARSCGCGVERMADLEIATREALANAMIHGNGRSAEKRVLLRCYGEPEMGLLIVIRDEGSGFDPASVADPRQDDRRHLPHGRGLFLMRRLMDFVDYRKGGREVILFQACRPT
jgi:anti-sigma regulatory factor (Ser/Thr protein kinase)